MMQSKQIVIIAVTNYITASKEDNTDSVCCSAAKLLHKRKRFFLANQMCWGRGTVQTSVLMIFQVTFPFLMSCRSSTSKQEFVLNAGTRHINCKHVH